MKPFARITDLFTESVIREMTRISDSIGGINLSQGFPDFDSPEEIKQAAIKAIKAGYNQYPVTYGEPELRNAIAKKAFHYNHILCNPETEITVTCGATEAMIATLMALINPGDEIIIFEPFYENYGPDTILSGATPRYVTLREPDWHIDEEELTKAFNSNTKAIIINTPNNPTGKVFKQHELELIANLCQVWDVYAITDEIYEHIIYDNNKHISIASLNGMEKRSITINSVSKTYSVTGWRVGWAIASLELTQRIRKVHDFLTVGAPCPFQHAASIALEFPKEYYVGLKDKYTHLRDFMYKILINSGFKVNMPEGAYYFLADISGFNHNNTLKSDFEFAMQFLERSKIATVPGSSFYSNRQNESNKIRFCFCKKVSTLNEAAKRVEKGINIE